ncbi:hypothetical protein PEC18_39580 [Paucibacter sp. O1-1]|nr:hypothetical protein [Paucibacter sp. O1-1]MDA3831712.1 hypothetical protein [Paucibacter sp. O1-1]
MNQTLTTVVWLLVTSNWKVRTPWDTFESIFEVGSVHKSTIASKRRQVCNLLNFPYGIEGGSAIKNLTKEDGTVAEVERKS